MAIYKIIGKEGEDTLIEKSGYTHEFKASALTQGWEKVAKVKQELEAQLRFNHAEMENIIHFHPFINDLSEQDRNTVFLYQRSAITAKEAEEKLKRLIDTVVETTEDIKEINKQTGLAIPLPDESANSVTIKAEDLGLQPGVDGEVKPKWPISAPDVPVEATEVKTEPEQPIEPAENPPVGNGQPEVEPIKTEEAVTPAPEEPKHD
jgi:hypothetical protein